MSKLPVYHILDFEFLNKSFYANDLPEHIRNHHFIENAHKHDFYLTVFFTKGRGTHEIDFKTYPVKKGAVFVMSPGQLHQWKLSADTEGYIFFHTEEFYNLTFANKQINDYLFFSQITGNPVMYLNGKEMEKVEYLFKNILEKYRTNDTYLKFQKLIILADLVYIELAELYGHPDVDSDHSSLYLSKLAELKKWIDKYYVSMKYPKEYAELMNMSSKHLNRICKETIKKTTSDLITERIILEAKRRLIHSGKTVKEIAECLGYDDPSYFIRLYRKHEGETPAAFQKKYH